MPGLIRGGGTEQFAMNANPAYNRDRLEEAHDLIIKTWTEPGPFRWEGDQYHFRVVNPWALPVQKPHPRIWVPGTSSLETVQWAAAHRYPYIGLGTDERAQKRIMSTYKEVAAEKGYEVGTWNFGQTIHFHVQDTMEHAMRNAREFMWMAGEFTGLGHPVWSSPSGYLWGAPDSPAAIARRRGAVARNNQRTGAKGLKSAGGGADSGATLQGHLDDLTWIMGDPDHAIAQLRKVLEQTRPGIVSFYATDGHISHRDNMRNIELIGKEVIPAMREMAKELDLKSPFEVDAPISLATTPARGSQALRVLDRGRPDVREHRLVRSARPTQAIGRELGQPGMTGAVRRPARCRGRRRQGHRLRGQVAARPRRHGHQDRTARGRRVAPPRPLPGRPAGP